MDKFYPSTKLDANDFGGTLILSPHSDDAALSLGGLIQKRLLKEPVTLFTIFGRSNYLRETAFQEDWREVTRQRKEEDHTFASAAGLRWKFLELPSAGLRLGSSFDRIFSDKSSTDTPIPVELIPALQETLNAIKPKFLLVPIGLGRHHDHLLVRDSARELTTGRHIVTIYFEDLPYAAEYSNEGILEHVYAVDPELQLTSVKITTELGPKLDALRFYRSQIGEPELRAVHDYAKRWHEHHAVERLWSLIFPLEFLGKCSL
jgi:LmbE family N-acetylglucosaminyl deacetylase